MTTETKPGMVDVYGKERCADSCRRVKEMLFRRPWVTGQIVETEQYGKDDMQGIDMFVPVRRDLVEMLFLEYDPRGLSFQVKSKTKKENCFQHKHEYKVLNLGTGENIFVLNGQEDYRLMLASLTAQFIAVACLAGYISEGLMLRYISESLGDREAFSSYLEKRDYIMKKKWIRKWLDGSKIEEWKQYEPSLIIIGK